MRKEYIALIVFGVVVFFALVGVVVETLIRDHNIKNPRYTSPEDSSSKNLTINPIHSYNIFPPDNGYALPLPSDKFVCPDSKDPDMCIFEKESNAQSYCDMDVNCKGYVIRDSTDPIQFVMVRKFPPSGGIYDFRIKGKI